jgi:hypothetical protein
MEKELFIFDLETYPNMFLAVFKSVKTSEYIHFEISDRRNQIYILKVFLRDKVRGLIGFNNLNFDYPVMHNTILKTTRILNSYEIYEEVENVIRTKYSSIYENQIKIPQLDLYKIWHYDNKNKATSLKWLEFAMRLPNVEDLPYAPGTILTFEQMDEIIAYCKNDIDATEQFYKQSLKHIQIRQFYTSQEDLPLMNASEIKMSKEIFGKYLAKEMKIPLKELTQLRTHRSRINIKDIVFDYLEFRDDVNQKTLDSFNDFVWLYNDDTEKAFENIKFTVPYKNVVREYAEGGLHSFGKAGIYESNDDYVLVDVDFASYYPHLSFRNKLHPKHIPEPIFNKIYESFYENRKLYDKKDPRNYVLKIILNGSYGLSKDKYAYLYDPAWQLAICVNGQLILTLLTERIFEKCKQDVQIIFENTDGAMYRIHRSDMKLLELACEEVEKIVNIPLEIQVCKKIIAKDVNNYINIIKDDNIKFKGCFEIDRDFHKNHSKRVVPIALANYFINGVDPLGTIDNHLHNTEYSFAKNYGIYDFCLGAKMKGSNKLIQRYWSAHDLLEKPLSKMNRYFISNIGVDLVKKLEPLAKNYLTSTEKHQMKVDANQISIFDIIEDVKIDPSPREENLESGYKCTLFNKYNVSNYDLNYDYYINECNKIINVLK